MDGLIAAAGVQLVVPALEYPVEKIGEVSGQIFLMLDISIRYWLFRVIYVKDM